MEFNAIDVRAKAENKEILKGINLSIKNKEIHAIMGPNGSGKSTFTQVILGNPVYEVEGELIFNGEALNELSTDERARKGIFLSFQIPPYLEGITLKNLLKKIYYLRRGYDERDLKPYKEFRREVEKALEILKLPPEFLEREVNKDLSGGEKKKSEMLQMLIFDPEFIILDEVDSGLDVDSLKAVSDAVNHLYQTKDNIGILIITHYNRILNHVKPTHVHVMKDGKIVKSGGSELANIVEKEGYGQI